ncbi:low molecular weight phosphotyrosine protein phosphatase [Vibrio hannami]|uniref:low molecular weight protein-tyrosine-phosphatase n=1 Tax=Vibrio hannami TaxID=2717094 RepID=UPI00240FF69B|nr:low molecular weight protein-tyrosine-phosphatase [Vibrio hannami]MDG3088241.1 low molecular weight phosphotyrosine protein phosphatase [Vibrio hannami]
MKSVLVLCTGNICRSPYGEYKLRSLCPELKVSSAGIATRLSKLQGRPADRVGLKVAAEFFGIDMSEHKANQVTQRLIDDHDIILAMEKHHLDELREIFPGLESKCYLYGSVVGVENIADPYMQGAHAFRSIFTLIDRASEVWVEKFRSLPSQG